MVFNRTLDFKIDHQAVEYHELAAGVRPDLIGKVRPPLMMLLYDYVIGRSIGGSICDILLWEEVFHQAPCLCRTLHEVGSIQCAVPRQIRARIITPV